MKPDFQTLFPGRTGSTGMVAVIFVAVALVFAVPGPAAARQGDPVHVRVVAQKDAVRPGEKFAVAVVLDHDEGFHTWPEASVKLPKAVAEVVDDNRTRIEVTTKPAWVERIDGYQWPPAELGVAPDPTGEKATIKVPLYHGHAVVFIRVQVAAGAAAGSQTLPIWVSYQSCNDVMCMQPVTHELEAKVRVLGVGDGEDGGGGGSAAEEKLNEPALFALYKPPAGGSGAGVANVTPPKSAEEVAKPQTPATSSAVAAGPSLFGFSLGGGLAVIFFLAAVGGFVMNLTPCVLPVIPIKVMTLSQHAHGEPRRAFVLGLWMALGVVSFWVAAGLPMIIFSKTAGDPSRLIFGTWWVTFSLGLLIALMGLGIMGLFTLNLPQSVYMINPKADTAWGSFVFGLMTAVLGLPCFGFVAGGLLAGAATLPPLTIMTVFAGLGVGMAAPYLVLSAKPQLLGFLPRTGPASNLVKQVMGLLLLAAAAYFVTAGLQGLMADKPYLSESITWWAVAFFGVIAAAWLTVRTWQISKAAWPKVIMPIIGIVPAALLVVWANHETNGARANYLLSAAASESSNGLITGSWSSYTPARLEKAKADQSVILVDFTARWCIVCKSWKARFLDTDPVRSRLRELNAVMLETDLTSKLAPGWKFLNDIGQTNVPTIAVYGPAIKGPIIFNAYTTETVMNALDQATGRKPTASSARP